MSGDVQPRKRKDKKKKRDDEASHGVHLTKMGSDDVHLHVQTEHGTGGHWCAKVIFFSLMTILLGLVCLIILENRGLSDVDTPLSESRFSNYFDGWVDEHRPADHDDHHGDAHGSPEDDHDDEHDDDHDEPLEEEADVSEGDEADEDENVTQEEAEEADNDEDEDEDENDENVTAEEEEDDNVTAEDENVTAEEDENENATAEDENVTAEDENVTAEDENVTAEDEDDNATLEATNENVDEDEDDDEEEDNNNTNEDNVDDNVTRETSKHVSMGNDEDDEDPFDEDEDDGNFDSIEKIVDNDASELELLKEKARQQAAAEAKNNPASTENDNNEEDDAEQASTWASSLTVKIGVGLALALVARLVLLKKNPITNQDDPAPEVLMKRRLTIASPEEAIPGDPDEMDELLPEDDFSEEEIEIEEEIEYIDDIEEDQPAEENEVDAGNNNYMPETFEQLNAMYRTKGYQDDEYDEDNITQTKPEPETYRSPYQTSINTPATNNNTIPKIVGEEPIVSTTRSNTQSQTPHKAPAIFEAPPPPPLVEARIDVSKYSPPRSDAAKKYSPPRSGVAQYSPPRSEEKEPKMEEPKATKKDVTHDMDYQPEDDDIDYDEDDIYDDEGHDDDSEELDDDDLDEEEDDEEGEEEDLSDVDDTELMNRLEAKYGKLPAKEYESDEDPDDPSWTQIKPKTTGGGAQSYGSDGDDDGADLFEQELRRANDEMMREVKFAPFPHES